MKIHIGRSTKHGSGLIASRDIVKGETVFIIKGSTVNFLINNKKQAEIAGLSWIGMGKNEWLDPINHSAYFNHSCNPNSGIRGRVKVVAIRNIKKGEEAAFDYSLNEADIFWSMECCCGAKNCRKTIRSIQFLPHKIFKKYELYVPKYYRRVFTNFNVSKFKDLKELQNAWVDFIEND